jgi:carboxypeptidase T
VDLNSITSQDITFQLIIDPNEKVEEIDLVLETINDGIVTELDINKFWLSKPQRSIYKNDFSTLNSLNNPSWALTTKEYFSPPASITDSPDGNYMDKARSEFTLPPFSLENAENAILNFYAKWDIENNYDYVQILASSDNLDFRPLCGKYTNMGTSDQVFGSQLYDGVQSEWVKEEMSLEDFLDKKQVWIKVVFKSDDFSNRDGFYMDDIDVKITDKINNISFASSEDIIIYPSLVKSDGEITIMGQTGFRDFEAAIYDINGTIVGRRKMTQEKMELKPYNLKNGMYFVHCVKNGVLVSISKLVIQD